MTMERDLRHVRPGPGLASINKRHCQRRVVASEPGERSYPLAILQAATNSSLRQTESQRPLSNPFEQEQQQQQQQQQQRQLLASGPDMVVIVLLRLVDSYDTAVLRRPNASHRAAMGKPESSQLTNNPSSPRP
ncbi:hypothetical protein EX30DRAFT_85597 [Ascodesmis nigricans]|uniref:Uncharacterized protein n=1 Tax=Ascodesmis nigricans TaxID=341454 RepID=A0A4S2N391_9PEZI|nr:hypothetical protein EX30DRAFT_85597 [Ascodesmis nigricans]